jgi:hypothetical protein
MDGINNIGYITGIKPNGQDKKSIKVLSPSSPESLF